PQTATLIDPPILFRPHVPSGFVWGIMESQHIHQFQEHSGQALKTEDGAQKKPQPGLGCGTKGIKRENRHPVKYVAISFTACQCSFSARARSIIATFDGEGLLCSQWSFTGSQTCAIMREAHNQG
ncbi:hypothetical protein ACFQPI_11570, partial [Insolitispirillum peregrinum]|uniref:hypothetical protein n=1 Tax=Insolitispirillum peregrinum TaxID=80876 RepID=UPI00361F6A94